MILGGVLALLLFPVAARLAADAQPVAPPALPPLPPLRAHGAAGAVRTLPAFITLPPARVAAIIARGPAAESRAISNLASSLFGRLLGRTLDRTVAHGAIPIAPNVPAVRLPPLPAPQRARENDLAALLIVAGSIWMPGGTSTGAFADAGPVALTLLDAAGAEGSCAPLLNRAFLLSSNSLAASAAITQLNYDLVQRAYARAAAACPGDPTSQWALTEYDSIAGDAGGTLATLERRFPRASATWSAAGDIDIRDGDGATGAFTQRQWYERALASYERAAALRPGASAWAGEARALADLNRFGAAVTAQRRALATDPASAELQARLLGYLEQDDQFGVAARVAARLSTAHRFAAGPALYAQPPDGVRQSTLGDDDDDGPLSTGLGTMKPVQLTVFGPAAFASPSVVAYLPFFPAYRPMQGIGGRAQWCPGWSRLVDLVLSGRPAAALRADSGRAVDLRPGAGDCDATVNTSGFPVAFAVGPVTLAGVADLELGKIAAARGAARRSGMTLSALEDLRQNLWRYGGNYAHAAAAAAQWAQTLPDDATAITREGEIAFLRGRYDDAAVDFAVVAARYTWTSHRIAEASTLLDEGTALAYAGRHGEALTTLAAAAAAANAGDPTGQGVGPTIASAAEEQAGDMVLDLGEAVPANQHYAIAATDAAVDSGGQATPTSPALAAPVDQALDNNWAIAEIGSGHPANAVSLAKLAIQQDGGDAIFWWSEADAERRLGHSATALTDYRAALARDPAEFPVANNIGVLLLRRGDTDAAVGAFRRAVGASPDYAIGWFNLGVALSRLGPAHVFAAQGSLARARSLDLGLASRAPEPIVDNTVYLSHLDLAKPLPPQWTFASSQRRAPVAAAGLSAILLLAVGLARSLAGRGAGANWNQMLPLLARLTKFVPRAGWLQAPAIAVAVTVACLLWPLHSGPTGGRTSVIAFTVGILILIALVIRVRQIAAVRAGLPLRQETWLPGVCLGLVLTGAGLGWAPLPVARAKAVAVHWAGPTAVAALAIALLVLAVWLNVPLTRSLGAAALVMAASMLTPVKPLDGATVSASPAGALPAIAVLGTSVLLVVGLL